MSKAVLISIQPDWCKKILSGEKTVEVRKTCPKLETPFKVYIYCTGHDGWVMKLPKAGVQKMDSRVIGEFTCDKIDKLVHVGTMMDINILTLDGWYKPADALLQSACLTEAQAEKYLKGSDGYGWHISDLKIYDRPRSLDEFSRFGFWGMNGTGVCGNYGCENYEPSDSCMIPPTCKIEGCSIYRSPQSWCYVQEMEVADGKA